MNTFRRFCSQYSQSNTQALRNPWVLGFFAILATFISVNLVFITIAFLSSPGLVVNDYYERGRSYEKNALKMIAAAEKTRAWQTKLSLPENLQVGKRQTIRFAAVDEKGIGLRGSQVKLFAYRPSDANADFSRVMQAVGPGLFELALDFPLKGIWDISITVKRDTDRYELTRRISVLP